VSAHVTERLSAYLDGEVPAQERLAIDAHLRLCASCARHLEDLAAVDELARALPVEAPAGYFESLPGRVRFKLEPRPRRAFALPTWSWAAAAALLLAVIAPRVLERQPSPAPVATREAQGTPAPRQATSPAQAAAPPPPSAPGSPPAEPRLGEARTSRDDRRARDQATFAEPPATPPPPLPARPAPLPMEQEQEKAQRAEPVAPAPGKAEDAAALAQPEAPAPMAKSAPYAAAPPDESVLEGAAAQRLPETYEQDKDVAEAAPAGAEIKKRAPGRASGGAALADADTRRKLSRGVLYRSLLALSPEDAAQARRAREEWRAFVALEPPAPEADEARVRLVEMGVKAWRFSNDPRDLVLLRQDAQAYLRRDDAAQGDRVRRLLDTTGN
jgi:hypothetical protein